MFTNNRNKNNNNGDINEDITLYKSYLHTCNVLQRAIMEVIIFDSNALRCYSAKIYPSKLSSNDY